MDKVYVIYWSQTGNTEDMAFAMQEGVLEANKECEVLEVSSANIDTLKEQKGFALGCPAMGAEELEEGEMEPFMETLEPFLAGKEIALFGSYGWGDGEWMRAWEESVIRAGATVVLSEGIIAQDAADEETKQKLKEAGSILAAL